jgi:hypothetical protein
VSVSPRKDPRGSHRASQISSQKATVGPKPQADLAGVKFQNVRKLKKCVDCFSAHGCRSGKKCDTWAKARLGNRTLTLSIPTLLILNFRILCVDKIGSGASAACITATTTTTTTTKISAPGRLQNADFPPSLLLVYETHNECRLGKTVSE